MPCPPYKVFISSRVESLAPYRGAVLDAIHDLAEEELHLEALHSERFAAESPPPKTACLQQVRACDIFMGILGESYSQPVVDEFREAHELGKIMLVFPVTAKARTSEQQAFLAEVNDWVKGHFIVTVTNPSELKYEAARSLRRSLFSFHETYLEHLAKEFSTVSLGGSAGKSLPISDTVPARVRLGDEDEQDRQDSRHMGLKALIDQQGRCLVIGPSGSGKTTALRQLTYELAMDLLVAGKQAGTGGGSATKGLLPVFVTLGASKSGLKERIRSFVSNRGQVWFDGMLSRKGDHQVVLLLDAFDEIRDDAEKDRLLADLNDLCQGNPELRYLISSRPLPSPTAICPVVCELDSLTDTEMQNIFVLHLGQSRGDALFRRLQDQDMLGAFRRPLMARFVTLAYEGRRRLPNSLARGAVYNEAIVNNLLRKWGAKSAFGSVEGQANLGRDFLTALGFQMFEENLLGISLERAQEIYRIVAGANVPAGDIDQLLQTLDEHALLKVTGDRIGFAHATILEFFAATYLARRGDLKLWLRLAKGVRWQPVLVYLVGILPSEPAREFLGSLVRSLRFLFWIARRGFPRDGSQVFFVLRCLVETACDCDDLKDQFMDYFADRLPMITLRDDGSIIRSDRQALDIYGEFCLWVGKLGTDKAVAYLRREPFGHREAVLGLTHVGDVDLLLELFSECIRSGTGSTGPDEYVLHALFEHPEERVKEALRDVLAAGAEQECDRFINALGWYAVDEGARNTGFLRRFDEELVTRLVNYACRGPNHDTRSRAIACLLNSEHSGKLPEYVEEKLIAAASADDPEMRKAALDHLWRSSSGKATVVLEKALADENIWVRFHALQTMRYRDAHNFPLHLANVLRPLFQYLVEQDYQEVATTWEAFKVLPDVAEWPEERTAELSVLVLGSRFGEPDFVRDWSVHALGTRHEKATVPYVTDVFESDTSGKVRATALFSLWLILGHDVMPHLHAAMRDEDGDVRGMVVGIFQNMPHTDQEIAEAFIQVLASDADEEVRNRAQAVLEAKGIRVRPLPDVDEGGSAQEPKR